jgi:hypothetical protein
MQATEQTQLTIGCENLRLSCFDGYINEFRASKLDASRRNHEQLWWGRSRTVGYWKFNETAGTMALTRDIRELHDASGNAYGGRPREPQPDLPDPTRRRPSCVPDTSILTTESLIRKSCLLNRRTLVGSAQSTPIPVVPAGIL